MKKEIYLVIYNVNNDSYVYGYFSKREEADKYCAKYSDNLKVVKTVYCRDSSEDFSGTIPKYEYYVNFEKNEYNSWEIVDKEYPDKYSVYTGDYFRSNHIMGNDRYITVFVNADIYDIKFAQRMAQDLLYRFLKFCDNKPDKKAFADMNEIFIEENPDKEELAQKELAELKRLKEKYGTG